MMAPPSSDDKSKTNNVMRGGGGGSSTTTTNALEMLMQGSKGRKKIVPTKKKQRSGGGGGGSSAVKHKKTTTTSSTTTATSSSTSRKSSGTGIGFVLCPAGCGRHIPNLDYKINQHLDKQCSVMMKGKQQEEQKRKWQQQAEEKKEEKKRRKQVQNEEEANCSSGSTRNEDVQAGHLTPAGKNDPVESMDCCDKENGLTPQPSSQPSSTNYETTTSISGPPPPPAAKSATTPIMDCTNAENLHQGDDANDMHTADCKDDNNQQSTQQQPVIDSLWCSRREQFHTPRGKEADEENGNTGARQRSEVSTIKPSQSEVSTIKPSPGEVSTINPSLTTSPGDTTTTSSTNSIVSPEAPTTTPQPTPPEEEVTAAHASLMNNPYYGTNSKRNLKSARPSTQSKDSNPKTTTEPAKNVFAHMMQQSSKVFAKKSSSPEEVQQYFSLEYDASKESFSWNLDTTTPPPLDAQSILWTCTVQLKDKVRQTVVSLMLSATCTNFDNKSNNNNNNNNDDETTAAKPRKARTAAAASAPPQPHNHQWVRYHSRLSVPVLKSILQKSVRRRKPLPSVRVAMELMDKALGELVRRLPIIILEDSTLHSDYGLVVWAMIAHSKGFFYTDDDNNLPSRGHAIMIHALKLRLLQIVYQVASCPVQDHLKQEVLEVPSEDQPCLSDPYPIKDKEQTPRERKDLQISIWAMLVRAQYGGMACDVRMLQGFALLWQDRMPGRNNGPTKATLLLPDCKQQNVQDWSQVPAYLHASAMVQSLTRIPSTLEQLTLTDLCREGVDFHCSNIVNTLLEDANIAGEAGQLIAKKLNLGCSSKEVLIKRCIWKFSAGVNLRRPLLPSEPTNDGQASVEKEEPLKAFWKDVLLPHVTAYQTKYVSGRIRRR